MKTTIIRLLLASLCAGAAWICVAESRLATRVADTQQAVATLDFGAVPAEAPGTMLSRAIPGDQALINEMLISKAHVAYWTGRYGDVAADTKNVSADADVLLAAANAAFRDAQRDPGTGLAAVQKLDGVLQAYASALKASPRHGDAAYNFEYVAHVRDQVARTEGKGVKPVPPLPLTPGADLPPGPTIHGAPGAPPPDAKMEDLQMIAPMEYGDREAQPEATPGGKRERKG